MAAIERDHLGPVLTHNPPGPPWVMDVGWWQGGVRWWWWSCVCLDGPGCPPPPVADYALSVSVAALTTP